MNIHKLTLLSILTIAGVYAIYKLNNPLLNVSILFVLSYSAIYWLAEKIPLGGDRNDK